MSTASEQTSGSAAAILAAIKSPMIFNALVVLVVGTLGWRLPSAHPSDSPLAWTCIGIIVAIALWLNIFAAINPRFLAYGPHEYLRESEMAHERKMKGVE
jgi:hypothetical protein